MHVTTYVTPCPTLTCGLLHDLSRQPSHPLAVGVIPHHPAQDAHEAWACLLVYLLLFTCLPPSSWKRSLAVTENSPTWGVVYGLFTTLFMANLETVVDADEAGKVVGLVEELA